MVEIKTQTVAMPNFENFEVGDEDRRTIFLVIIVFFILFFVAAVILNIPNFERLYTSCYFY